MIVVGCDETVDAARIPGKFDGSPVFAIGDMAFVSCYELEEVVIPDSVTTIGGLAFHDCEKLQKVTLGNNVTTIGGSAFSWCHKLTDLTLPDSLTTIEASAFESCGSLTKINIPRNVTHIGERAFLFCRRLQEITVDPSNSIFSSIDGVVLSKEQDTLLLCPGGKTGIYAVPDCVTTIGNNAFDHCKTLTDIILHDNVTTIGDYAFTGCEFTGITIPQSITTIDRSAFFDCPNLTEITIPESVTTFGGGIFSSCSALKKVTLPANLEKIPAGMFAGCTSLTELTIPDGTTTICDSAFSNCGLEKITIPSSVTEIEDWAFVHCEKLRDVYYKGTKQQWNNIVIGVDNKYLLNATIHFLGEETIPTTGTAYNRTQDITLDGSEIELQAYALKNEKGYETNYVKLRDIAMLINGSAAQFNVDWDGAVNIITGTAYEPNGTEMATPFAGDRNYEVAFAETKIDGTAIKAQAILLKNDQGGGYTYYKLRDIAKALNFDVSWSADVGITIDTDKPYTDD